VFASDVCFKALTYAIMLHSRQHRNFAGIFRKEKRSFSGSGSESVSASALNLLQKADPDSDSDPETIQEFLIWIKI
jgi:hypothetical protein